MNGIFSHDSVRYIKKTFAWLLKATILMLIIAMMGSEWTQFKVADQIIKEVSFKYSTAAEFEKLTKGQMAFRSIEYEKKLINDRGFVVEGPPYGGRSERIILHIPFLNTPYTAPRLHLKLLYGSKVWVFNEDNKLLYFDDQAIITSHVLNELSEAYIPYDPSGINVLIEGRNVDHFLGVEGPVSVIAYDDSLRNIFLEGYARRVIAFFLIIAAAMLYMIKRLFSMEQSKDLFEALGFFFGIFGVWIMLDFGRYSLWILETFHGVPVVILKIIYLFALAFLNYSFANLCYRMLPNSVFKRFLNGLRIYALVFGCLYFASSTLLLFYWSPFFNRANIWVEHISMGSISAGSFILLLISIVEAIKGNRTAVIFSIGFAICEATFVVSQMTDILISHWGVLILAMTFAVIISHEFNLSKQDNISYTAELVQNNKAMSRLYSDLEGAQHEILYLLGSAVDLRSKETSNHVKRVAEYTRVFARELGYGRDESERIALASTLHDIGKVGIADTILNKPGKLTTEEYEIMKAHAQMGYDMLKESELELIRTAAIIAMNHHERFDGKGYPNGFAGDEIHPYGRIVAASDVLDALLSSRVYKDPWPFEVVMDYFKTESGKQFEPAIVEVLIRNESVFKDITESCI